MIVLLQKETLLFDRKSYKNLNNNLGNSYEL